MEHRVKENSQKKFDAEKYYKPIPVVIESLDYPIRFPYDDVWVKEVKKELNYKPKDKSIENRVELNKRITKAYAKMYEKNPDIFKWTGLAAIASSQAGSSMEILSLQIKKNPILLELLEWHTNTSFEKIYKDLADGNLTVFTDMMRQHYAYRDCGLDAIEKLKINGKLAPKMYQSWKVLDEGRMNIKNGKKSKGEGLIWQATRDFADNEQNKTLQKRILNRNRKNWKSYGSSSILEFFSPIKEGIESSNPEDFHEYVKRKFPGVNPDFSSPKQRWCWINENIIPKFQKYESTKAWKKKIHLLKVNGHI